MPDSSPSRPVSGEDPWLTVPQVSAQLRIHPATVRIWINNGRLAAVRVGREWRVRQSDVARGLLVQAPPRTGEEGRQTPPPVRRRIGAYACAPADRRPPHYRHPQATGAVMSA